MDVTVCIATYGDFEHWRAMGNRAAASVPADVPVVRVHGDSIHEARNAAAAQVRTEWICALDADDELEAGYFEAMETSHCDLRAPLVRYVVNQNSRRPAQIPEGTFDMANGNKLVIGTLIRKAMFDQVGGFRDYPMYEDWDLWQRCWLAGATIGFTDAVYRAHVRPGSRNRAPSHAEKLATHHAIRSANMPWLYEAAS